MCSAHLSVNNVTTISACEHTFCNNCMSEHLKASRQLRKDPTAPHHPDSVKTTSVMSIFKFRKLPDLPVHDEYEYINLPCLCVTCPHEGCPELIRERDIDHLPEFAEDYVQSMSEADQHITAMRIYRICGLSDVICGEGLQPVSQFIQLSCSHFFHPDCLAPLLRHRIDNEIKKDTPSAIVCPECERDNNKVNCFCCEQKNHVITEQEVVGLMSSPEVNFTENEKVRFLEIGRRVLCAEASGTVICNVSDKM